MATVPSRPKLDADRVEIRLDGKLWQLWDDCELSRSVDAYDTAAFVSPFNVANRTFKEAFRPFAFSNVEIAVGGQKFFTGTMVDVAPSTDENGSRVAVACYALPGVLIDSAAPISLLPFEARGLTLKQIAERVCRPFGLAVEFTSPPGPAFRRVKQKLDARVQDYLVELAHMRGLVLGNDAAGRLVFKRSVGLGSPVARLVSGRPPVLSVTPTFNARNYYSEITGVVSTKITAGSSKYTATNPRLVGRLRADTVTLEDAEQADAPTAVRARLGRMFGNAYAVSVEVPTWRDPAGNLWAPDTTVSLLAPEAMIYTESQFLVRSVVLRTNAAAKTTTLSLALPGAFSGEIPSRFPWD